MKIALCLNVLNEEKNIERILSAYHDWVDYILIVDGGSTDRTVEKAVQFTNTFVVTNPALTEVKPGIFLNNITRHVEQLVELATEYFGVDWIIYDDCDCVPNNFLRQSGRSILEEAYEINSIFVPRFYVYGKDKHFPKMVAPFGEYVGSLWAWRTSFHLELKESVRHLTITNLPEKGDSTRKDLPCPPYGLLHYFAPDEETIQRKMQMQRTLVGHDVQHPLQFGGELENLPAWVIEWE